jgi:hypothetical protein
VNNTTAFPGLFIEIKSLAIRVGECLGEKLIAFFAGLSFIG